MDYTDFNKGLHDARYHLSGNKVPPFEVPDGMLENTTNPIDEMSKTVLHLWAKVEVLTEMLTPQQRADFPGKLAHKLSELNQFLSASNEEDGHNS